MSTPSAFDLTSTEDAVPLVGHELGPSDWLQVTQERVDSFGRSVEDWHWAHNDPERAAQGPFGAPIAHAHPTLGAVPHLRESILTFRRGEVKVYGYDKSGSPHRCPSGPGSGCTP